MGQAIFTAAKDNADVVFCGGSSSQYLFDKDLNPRPFEDNEFISALNECDYIIDFSSPKANAQLKQSLNSCNSPKSVLIGTTGMDSLNHWQNSPHKVIFAPNTSIGVATLRTACANVAKTLAPLDFDIEICETHHRHKVDTPSGTALLIAEAIKEATGKKIVFNRSGERGKDEIGIVALRGGGVKGEHSVRFISELEEVEISHRAFDRKLFAKGALDLLGFFADKGAGIHTLSDLNL